MSDVNPKRTIVPMTSGQLDVRFAVGENGISLLSVTDLAEGGGPILSSARPLFYLTAERVADGTVQTLRSDENFPHVTVAHTADGLLFSADSGDPVPGISVSVCVRAVPSRNRLEFSAALESENEDYILVCCDYPAFWFDVTDAAMFLSPYGSGEALKADSERFGHAYQSTQEYPSYGVSFQFMAYWDSLRRRMVYYGIEDPIPASKRFSFLREENDSALCIKASLPLEGADRAGNGQPLRGTCVWELGDGDWYDATLRYRDWMEQNASWLPEKGSFGRADSAWLEEIDAWWLVHVNGEFFADDIISAAEELGVPTAVHLYLWHQIPFDNDYPHYFPEKVNICSELKKLHAAGIRVVPYINGRLWDTRDRGMEDWEFSAKAKPFATKDRHGTLFTETYSSKEEDGSPVVLSIMCPSTGFWQETVKGVTDQLFDRIGFDGVYLDQIAAAKPQLCADPLHHHPAGGGVWWNQSYNRLTGRVKEGRPDRILATECTAEMFMRNIQAYLSWLWVKNDQVPAFPVLYSDKVHLFGIAFGDVSYADIFIAQSLLFGEQMGWLSPSYYRKLPHREFYRTLVRTRNRLHNLLSHGTMLRPPVLTDDAPRLTSDACPHAYFRHVDYPAVQGAQWLEKETGRKYMILVNAGEPDAFVRMETDFPDGTYPAEGIDGDVVIRGGKAELTVPGLTAVWWRETP
ncbi:MAG: hypothetical protein ILO68_01530 [Clostridia bacterium]|nr:hypothetical protein [Clostridia bacterium]